MTEKNMPPITADGVNGLFFTQKENMPEDKRVILGFGNVYTCNSY